MRVRQEVQALLWQTHAALIAKALFPSASTLYVGKISLCDVMDMALLSHVPACASPACKGRRKYVPTGRSNRVPTGAAMNRRPDILDSFFIERSCAVLNFSGTA